MPMDVLLSTSQRSHTPKHQTPCTRPDTCMLTREIVSLAKSVIKLLTQNY